MNKYNCQIETLASYRVMTQELSRFERLRTVVIRTSIFSLLFLKYNEFLQFLFSFKINTNNIHFDDLKSYRNYKKANSILKSFLKI